MIPPIHSALSLDSPHGRGVISALTGYVANQGDGWIFTLDALSRYFDRVLEARLDPATADPTDLIGGVYPERMRSLGRSIAALHCALAGEGGPAFAPEPFGPLYQRSLYQAMRGEGGRVLRLLRKAGGLSAADRETAARVIDQHPAMLHIFEGLLRQRFRASKIRVHGDLHLGQLLNTGKDFVFIDFEGEAVRPLGERALKRCPLVDLAAMLRSLDCAAATALRSAAEGDREALRPWAALWVNSMTTTLRGAYFSTVDATATFLPAAIGERDALLTIFLLDRALRELAHEINRGSALIDVPLNAAAKLLSVAPHE